jgi:DNA-binding MarR family transcriptional regulator
MSTLELSRFLPYRLSVTSNRVSDRIASQYRATFGLTIPEWRVIAVLAEQGAMTQQGIGQMTYMDKVTVSRAAIALVERSLVARRPNPQDKRSHLLDLSWDGRELYAAIVPRALAMEKAIFVSLSPKDRAALIALLQRIDEAVDSTLDHSRTGAAPLTQRTKP